MATNLEQKLEQILEEKNTKIKPENLKEGITAFGVPGTLKPLSITDDATATDEDIFFGKIAYGRNEKILGTMPNNGTLDYSPSLEQQIIPKGYTDGGIIEAIPQNELKIEVKEQSQSFEGIYTKVDVDPIITEDLDIMPTRLPQTYSGLYKNINIAGENNLLPENIAKDKTIFGIKGTHEGGDNTYNATIANPNNRTNFALTRWITEMAEVDMTGVTNASGGFDNCENLKKITIKNMSQITTASTMFQNCRSLLEPPELDLSNATNIYGMFYNCKGLTTVNGLEGPKVTTAYNLFAGCTKLQNVNNVRLPVATSPYAMFSGCTNLYKVLGLYLPAATALNNLFNNCQTLNTFDGMDMSKVNNTQNMFYECRRLRNLGPLTNLGKGFTIKSNNATNHTIYLSTSPNLTHDSLLNLFNGLYDLNLTYDVANGGTLYSQKITLGDNKSKLTADEIAIATSKRLEYCIKGGKNMFFFDYTRPKMAVAEQGKHIRERKDVYVPEYIDEDGNVVPEHFPYYTTTIFVPDIYTKEKIEEEYIEEPIDKE